MKKWGHTLPQGKGPGKEEEVRNHPEENERISER